MKQKIFCFNKTIFHKNITQFWPIWLLYTVVCMWMLPFRTYINMNLYEAYGTVTEAERLYIKVSGAIEGMSVAISPLPIFCFAAASALAVFAYLYSSRCANMMHALPVTRTELFITNYISGLLFLWIPQLIAFLIAVFVWFGNEVNQLEYLLQWLGMAAGMALFSYSLAVVSVMLTGHIVTGAAYFFLLNYLVVGVQEMVGGILQVLVYGISASQERSFGKWLSPLPFLMEKIKIVYDDTQEMALPAFDGQIYVAGYVLAAFVLIALALYMYRKRRIETTGDVICICWMKPVFRWGGGIAAAGILPVVIINTFFYEKEMSGNAFPLMLICSIITGFLGFFAVEMIIQKQFTVFSRKRFGEAGIFLGIILLFLTCLEMDVFGIEKRVPDAEEISYIYVNGTYAMYLDEEKQIEEYRKIHENIINSKAEYEKYFEKYVKTDSCYYLVLEMEYGLKNGRRVKRAYYLPMEEYFREQEDSAVRQYLAFERNPQQYLVYYFSDMYSSIQFLNDTSFAYFDKEEEFCTKNISREDQERLFEALKEDILEGEYCIYPYDTQERKENTYMESINFGYIAPKGARILQYGENGELSDGKLAFYTQVTLTKDCVKTIALLEELGYLNEDIPLITEKEYDKTIYSYD